MRGASAAARTCRDSTRRAGSPAQRPRQGVGVLLAQDGPLVRRQERRCPADALTHAARGDGCWTSARTWPAGSVSPSSGNAGQKVVLKHAEVLDAAGNFYTENLRGAKARVEYVLKGGGRETFEPHFTFQGFRYVMIEEYPGSPSCEDFEAVVIHSDLEPTGTFECSHELLNALHRNILWSLKGNFVDIPTDCPQRDERLGWTGDAQVFIRHGLFHLRARRPFYRKWLRDLAPTRETGEGCRTSCPTSCPVTRKDPMIPTGLRPPGWGDAAVICPWTLYAGYGRHAHPGAPVRQHEGVGGIHPRARAGRGPLEHRFSLRRLGGTRREGGQLLRRDAE